MVHCETGSGVQNSKPPSTTLKAHSLALAAGEWLSTVQPPWSVKKCKPGRCQHFWVSRPCVGGWSPSKCPRKATQSHSRCRKSWRSIPKPEENSSQHRVCPEDFIETPTDRAPVLVYSFATSPERIFAKAARQEQDTWILSKWSESRVMCSNSIESEPVPQKLSKKKTKSSGPSFQWPIQLINYMTRLQHLHSFKSSALTDLQYLATRM